MSQRPFESATNVKDCSNQQDFGLNSKINLFTWACVFNPICRGHCIILLCMTASFWTYCPEEILLFAFYEVKHFKDSFSLSKEVQASLSLVTSHMFLGNQKQVVGKIRYTVQSILQAQGWPLGPFPGGHAWNTLTGWRQGRILIRYRNHLNYLLSVWTNISNLHRFSMWKCISKNLTIWYLTHDSQDTIQFMAELGRVFWVHIYTSNAYFFLGRQWLIELRSRMT